jgi:Na+/proline symporter/signal transduction histidine kinase
MLNLGYIDAFIVITFLITCLVIGLLKTSEIKSLKEFALGYPNISVTILVCIIFASSASAGSTIGITGKIYEQGAIFALSRLFISLSWIISSIIIARKIDQFKGCISLGEIMYRLYGSAGRWITASVAILRSLGYLAAQAIAMGLVFNYFFNIDTNYGVLIGYSIITIYAALGGIRAVIYTEIFKFSIFFLIIPISYIFVFSNTGGLVNFIDTLPTKHTSIIVSVENITLLSSFALYYLLPSFSPDFIQKFLIAKDSRQLQKALTMIALISIPFSGAFCLIAYKMKSLSPGLNPNDVLLHFISFLPPILKGLMVAGLIAIIMSMAEAKINAASVTLVNDILNVLYPNFSNIKQLIALRLSTIILSISSLAIINLSNDILDLVWLIANFWDPIIAIPAIVGFLGFRTNTNSFITSVITAMAFTVLGRFLTGEFAIASWSLGVIGSAIGLFGAHYWQVKKGLIEAPQKPYKLPNPITWVPNKINAFFKSLSNLIVYIINTINTREDPHQLKIREFCTFTLAYYFAFSFHITAGPDQVIFAYLISIGYALCLLLLFREFVFTKRFINRYMHLYWHFLLTFCLPFVSSYMLFVGHGDDFWIISGMLSAFALSFFVDSRRFLLLYSIGALAGYILFRLNMHKFESYQDIPTTSKIGYVYLFFLFSTLFFLRRKEKEQEEKLMTMEMFGGAMAHEVKSPLATLNMCAQTVDTLLTKTFQGETEVGDSYYIKVQKEDADILKKFSDMLKKISMKGITTVEGLLLYLKNNIIADDLKEYSILECVNEALSEYDNFNDNKINIEVKIKDFLFYGSKHYVKHVLFNLITNAYKYAGKDAKVEVWTTGTQLHFKDYGKGIDEEKLPRIFEKFYTNSKTGTGIGLAFCKRVMEDLGGDIECTSELGKYTHFTLYFPKIKKRRSNKI